MPDGFPFTVYESQVRLYTVDANGEPLAQQWIGCVDTVELEGEFRERPVQYAGRRTAKIYQEDEAWRITITGARLIDLRPSPPRPVVLRRNQEYAMVIVWWDKRMGYWLKRCYFGVKAQPASVSGLNIMQTLKFSAEEMAEVAGAGTTPDFSLLRTGNVFYVDGPERTLLYEYDPTTRAFNAVATDQIPDKAEIVTDVAGEVRITIGGELALLANSDGVEVGEIIAIGGTFVDASERLEFWVQNTRCASLSVDQLAAPDVLESLVAPTGEKKFEVFNPSWLFTISSARVVAPSFSERP